MPSQQIAFDAGLLRRYDRPGPRYTSYPTAPQFSADFGEAALREVARASNEDPIPRPLSLYVHVPFCFSPCFYCGCNRIITRDLARGRAYLDRLGREIALVAPLFDRDREVIQLHFGGGTPNFLDPAQLCGVVDPAPRIPLRRQRRPRHLDRTRPALLQPGGHAGAGRGRLQPRQPGRAGLRSEGAGRGQPDPSVEETRAIVDACRGAGMRSVNIDLIYGLPGQSLDGFRARWTRWWPCAPTGWRSTAMRTCRTCSSRRRRSTMRCCPTPTPSWPCCRPRWNTSPPPATSTSAWIISPCPTTNWRWHRRVAACIAISWATPPTPTATWSAWASARSATSAAASARTRATCPPGRRRSMQAGCRCSAACAWMRTTLIRADLIQSLMCQGEVRVRAFQERHGIGFAEYFAADLQRLWPLADDGLVEVGPDAIRATPRGRLLLRNIAMCFDRYLDQTSVIDARPRFSRAI
jgi:oxygen-independent coproporphyrinogen-3 oxidase